MNRFLENIIIKSGYYPIINRHVILLGNENEYFIIEYFEIEEFENFFKSEKLDSLISKFQLLEDRKIQKNTSLFVLVKVDNLSEFYKKNLNNIMDIEEDNYYFRKYVILYTDDGLNRLEFNTKFLIDYVQGEDSKNQSLFEKFEKNMFFEESYFIAMQLIIKLPFISPPHESRYFGIIEDRIKLRIEESEAIEREEKVNDILEMLDKYDIEDLLNKDKIYDELNTILGDV